MANTLLQLGQTLYPLRSVAAMVHFQYTAPLDVHVERAEYVEVVFYV